MKFTKILLLTIFSLFFSNFLFGQVVLSFSNPTVIGNKFRINLDLASTGASLPLGNNNLRFNFSASALSNPIIAAENFSSVDFGSTTTTGTNTSTGLISINTSYIGFGNNSIILSSSPISLVTMEFDIINPSLLASFTWRITGANPKCVIMSGGNTSTQYTITGINLLNNNLYSINAGPDVTLNCTNPSSILTATNGANYLWSTGATTSSISVSPSTTTTYSVTSTNGSVSYDQVTITVDKAPPPTNAGPDVTMNCDSTSIMLNATGGITYLWDNGSTISNIVVSPTITTTYSVTATSANGCTASDGVLVTIVSCPLINSRVLLNQMNAAWVTSLTNFPHSDPYANGGFNGQFTHINNNSNTSINNVVLSVTGNNAIVDWLFLELRTGVSGVTSVAYTKSALLQADGDIVDLDGTSPVKFSGVIPGDYYIAVRHHNSLGFRTANKIALSSTLTSLDFTNPTALHGATPLVQIAPNVYTMIGGDANADGSIDAFDSIIWELQNGLFNDYTQNADYNMDGSIDAFDSIIWELNNGNYQELD